MLSRPGYFSSTRILSLFSAMLSIPWEHDECKPQTASGGGGGGYLAGLGRFGGHTRPAC
jgi:hypothetical protein